MRLLEILGGGVGIGALITAIVGIVKLIPALRRTERAATAAANELTPNHGSSVKDILYRVEHLAVEQSRAMNTLREETLLSRKVMNEDISQLKHSYAMLDAQLKALHDNRTAPTRPDSPPPATGLHSWLHNAE